MSHKARFGLWAVLAPTEPRIDPPIIHEPTGWYIDGTHVEFAWAMEQLDTGRFRVAFEGERS